MTVRAHHQPTAGIHPRDATLDRPALSVACAGTQRMSALGVLTGALLTRWHGKCDPTPTQRTANLGTIVGFVRSQFVWSCFGPTAGARDTNRPHRRFSQGAFVWVCTVHVQANGYTGAINHDHHLRAVANLCLAYTSAPLFAGKTLPSSNACAHARLPSASSWRKRVRQMRSHVPSYDHSCHRRQQVLGDPYSFGRSAQALPMWSTYRIPFSVRRSSLRGRPRARRFLGMSGSITVHWSSVRSCLLTPLIRAHVDIFEIGSMR
jgi:hypothetical protein